MFLLTDPEQVIVGGIETGPGSRAGLHWGDVLLSVNGVKIANQSSSELEGLLSSDEAKTLSIEIDRLGVLKTVSFTSARARDIAQENGKQYFANRILPSWVTQADVSCFQ